MANFSQNDFGKAMALVNEGRWTPQQFKVWVEGTRGKALGSNVPFAPAIAGERLPANQRLNAKYDDNRDQRRAMLDKVAPHVVGALSGAATGSVGGPIGALVGGAAGALSSTPGEVAAATVLGASPTGRVTSPLAKGLIDAVMAAGPGQIVQKGIDEHRAPTATESGTSGLLAGLLHLAPKLGNSKLTPFEQFKAEDAAHKAGAVPLEQAYVNAKSAKDSAASTASFLGDKVDALKQRVARAKGLVTDLQSAENDASKRKYINLQVKHTEALETARAARREATDSVAEADATLHSHLQDMADRKAAAEKAAAAEFKAGNAAKAAELKTQAVDEQNKIARLRGTGTEIATSNRTDRGRFAKPGSEIPVQEENIPPKLVAATISKNNLTDAAARARAGIGAEAPEPFVHSDEDLIKQYDLEDAASSTKKALSDANANFDAARIAKARAKLLQPSSSPITENGVLAEHENATQALDDARDAHHQAKQDLNQADLEQRRALRAKEMHATLAPSKVEPDTKDKIRSILGPHIPHLTTSGIVGGVTERLAEHAGLPSLLAYPASATAGYLAGQVTDNPAFQKAISYASSALPAVPAMADSADAGLQKLKEMLGLESSSSP